MVFGKHFYIGSTSGVKQIKFCFKFFRNKGCNAEKLNLNSQILEDV